MYIFFFPLPKIIKWSQIVVIPLVGGGGGEEVQLNDRMFRI